MFVNIIERIEVIVNIFKFIIMFEVIDKCVEKFVENAVDKFINEKDANQAVDIFGVYLVENSFYIFLAH